MRTLKRHIQAPDPVHYRANKRSHSSRCLSKLLSMIYRRNKVSYGTIKMSGTEEYSLQNKTGTINITTVNVDKIHFKNLLIVFASVKRDRPTRCHSGKTGKNELTSQTAKNLKTVSQEIETER
jgi:ABC-type cobalamin/Fe3+-siderophores transport system ATPase subunit